MTNPFKRFFLFCSGASGAILNKKGCETENIKYAGIGATIFFTAALASLSGGYAVFTVFHDPMLSAAFGLFWGLIIFNLDRFIVSSIRKRRAPANASVAAQLELKAGELLKALPRLILAIFISVVITRPIELKLFEVEIGGQMTKDLSLERAGIDNSISQEYVDIERLRDETNKLKNRKVELENEVNRRVLVANNELEGGGGTRNPGHGPEYKRRLGEVAQAQADLKSFDDQYGPIIQANEQKIRERETEKSARSKKAEEELDKSRGLLRRLDALSRLTSDHSSIFWTSGFLMLLFISLETAPILVKLFSNRGPYDDYLDAAEHQVYAERQQEISNVNIKINTDIAWSKQMYAASLNTLIPQELHEAQVDMALERLALWKAGQLNNLNRSTTPAQPGGHGQQPIAQSAQSNGSTAHGSSQTFAQTVPAQPPGSQQSTPTP